MSLNDIHSLSHMSWNCKYHIVFAPKYLRKVFYKNHIKEDELGEQLTMSQVGPFTGSK